MKVIIDSDLQAELRNTPTASEEQIKEVLKEAGCKELITGYFSYKNPFGQTVAVVEKMPRPLLVYGITWKEIE